MHLKSDSGSEGEAFTQRPQKEKLQLPISGCAAISCDPTPVPYASSVLATLLWAGLGARQLLHCVRPGGLRDWTVHS